MLLKVTSQITEKNVSVMKHFKSGLLKFLNFVKLLTISKSFEIHRISLVAVIVNMQISEI